MKQKNPIYTLMEKHEVELSVLKRAACDRIGLYVVDNDIWLDKPIVNDMYSKIQHVNRNYAIVEERNDVSEVPLKNLSATVIAQIEDAVIGKKYTVKLNPIKQKRKELIDFIVESVGDNTILLSVHVNIGNNKFLTGFKPNLFCFERNEKKQEWRLIDALTTELEIMAETFACSFQK